MKEKYKYTTYLIGCMEKPAEKDDGSAKREKVEKEFILRDVYTINPVKLESFKTGMSTDDIKEKMTGWVAGGCWDLFRKHAIEIWKGKDVETECGNLIHIPGDIDYVKMSDWLTFVLNKGDMPCGSYFEAGIAMEHGIPVYLVTDYIKSELPKSLLQCIEVSGGEVFSTENKFFDFVDKKYGLVRQEKVEKEIKKTIDLTQKQLIILDE